MKNGVITTIQKYQLKIKTDCSIEKLNIWKSNFKAKIKDKVILEFIFG